MRHDVQLLKYVLLLRYGCIPDAETAQPILNYASIAKLMRKPVTTVIELIKAALAASRYGFSCDQFKYSKYAPHHIGYLISSETL